MYHSNAKHAFRRPSLFLRFSLFQVGENVSADFNSVGKQTSAHNRKPIMDLLVSFLLPAASHLAKPTF